MGVTMSDVSANDDPLTEPEVVIPLSTNGYSSQIPKWVGIGLFLYASVFTLAYAKDFLVPIVLAFLLAMVFGPIRRFFDRRGVPSALTSLVIVVGLLVATVAVIGAIALPVSGWMQSGPEILRTMQTKLSGVSDTISEIFAALDKLKAVTSAPAVDVQQVEVHDNGVLTSAALFAPAVLTQFMFTLILLLFILWSGDMFYEKLVHVLPTFKDKRQAMRIAHDIERKLSRYLLTITLINAALGTVVAVAMWLLGMPSPAVFGVMAFLLTYVPYLGAIAGIAVVSGIALLTFDSTGWVATVGGVYLLISSIEGQFVTPYFVGRSLRLNTVVVFIAVSFWAWLWSAVGLLVAVPLLVAINTFCQHIDALNGFGKFLSERHAEKETETSASSP
jgi:predicted PurR-regulated permease PerM